MTRRLLFVAPAVALLAAAGCGVSPETSAPPAAPSVSTEVTVGLLPADDTTAPPVVVDLDGTAETGDQAAPATSSYSVVAQAVVPEVIARAEPDDDAPAVATLANPTASGSHLVFRAVDPPSTSPDWILVHLPVQPNGSTGWVKRSEVTLSNTPYRVEIDRAAHALRVYDLDRLWVETPIAVGTGDTPTPVGEFYLMELIKVPEDGGPYGPYAFGLSGFSEVLDSFGGADTAIIGLHGTNDPSSLGTDVSHGCIRLANEVITELAAVLPLGTPVVIT